MDDGDSINTDFNDLLGYDDHIGEPNADQEDDGNLNHSNAADDTDNTSFDGGGVEFAGATAVDARFAEIGVLYDWNSHAHAPRECPD